MKLEFLLPNPEYSAAAARDFTKDDLSPFWKDIFFRFYSDIDRDRFIALNSNEKYEFLKAYFQSLRTAKYDELKAKNERYNAYWKQHERQITASFEDVFELDLSREFNDLIAQTSFNPISPRYLAEHRFDHFYLESERGAMGTSLHEITHFIWFLVWQNHFKDSADEYETPHLKWILSEMVVEPIMQKSGLSDLNPYCASKSCAYPYFYSMVIDNRPILDTLSDMLENNHIADFMEKSYQYCQKYESDIRQHISRAEQQF